jgi:hypothetical protein
VFEKKIRFKEPPIQGLFQKLQKIAGFDERTDKDQAIF